MSSFDEFVKSSTTLDVTIEPECEPTYKGTQGSYFKLQYSKGQKPVLRKELICNTKYPSYKGDDCNKCNFFRCKCEKKKRIKCDKCKKTNCRCKQKLVPLVSFVHISDIHLIDAANPSRASFLGVFIEDMPALSDAFRSYEALTMQVAECMIRKINSVGKGPHLHQKFSFVVSTGDNADSETINELQNYVNMLDGTQIVPNPASKFYTGVQDNVPTPAYGFYYHPDPPPPGVDPDMYKTDLGYPDYPNILDAAAKPFCATGLKVPWFSCNGNHCVLKLGNYSLGFYEMLILFDQIATGKIPNLGSKLIDYMSPIMAEQFAVALQTQDAKAALDIISKSVLRDVPRSEKRKQFTRADFISTHFKTTVFPGKVGHGFDERNIALDVAYYTFKMADNITGIMLDTCNPNGNLTDLNLAPNGAIGRVQIAWLEQELQKRHSNFYNTQGELVCTDNKDELIVLWGHHSIETLNNPATSPTTFDNDPQRILGDEFLKIIHRYPNVILYLCGHEHLNRITPFPDPTGRTGGLYQCLVASHIDYPQQSRILEIADGGDLIHVFSTVIDHQSPANVDREKVRSSCCGGSHSSEQSENNSSTCKERYTIEEMASISRELSYNDIFIVPKFDDGVYRTGLPSDRNAELLIFNPLKRCKPCNC